ncbi:hypothetical protein, partial [Alkalibacterium indicireducens]|uniref:hypothetical protein n=1 Tax=Alkalibacterium indicireducens TaxID=398758 RepID=UPI0031F7D7CB
SFFLSTLISCPTILLSDNYFTHSNIVAGNDPLSFFIAFNLKGIIRENISLYSLGGITEG